MIKKLLLLAVTSGLAAKALQMWTHRETVRGAGPAPSAVTPPALPEGLGDRAASPVQSHASTASTGEWAPRLTPASHAAAGPVTPAAVIDAPFRAAAGGADLHTRNL